MDAATLQQVPEVWRAANSGASVGDVQPSQRWRRISTLIQGWPVIAALPPTEWFAILPRLRSALVVRNAPTVSDEMDGAPVAALATASREAAADVLKHLVAAALRATSLADGVEVHRQQVTRLLSAAPAGGGVLDLLLALFTQEEADVVVASAAQALGFVAQAVGEDEQLKREQLIAPSTLLKAIKQMVRRLNQLAQKQGHSSGLAGVVRGAMACLRALGGTVRPQCAIVEEACLHLLDSPHADVRRAVAECFSVRPWCGGISEWPALVGSMMSTIHVFLDTCYPTNEAASNRRKGLTSPFQPPQRSAVEGIAGLERRLATLFTSLRHCLAAPPTNQPERAVPVPIPHLLGLIHRVLTLSPTSTHFDRLDRTKLGLWTFLPNLHAHAYRLLSSLIACVGRHLLPHHAAIRRLIVHGLERNGQVRSAAWTRTSHHLLESISLAFPVLASCFWKDSAAAILSLVLPLLSSPVVPQTATQKTLQLSALRVVGAVVRHAGPLLSSLHAIEIHRTVLAATTKAVSHAFQEEARRVLSDCCLLPQTAPLLPSTLQLLQRDGHLQSTLSTSSPASTSGATVLELLIHPRVLPRVRLAPPPLPTVAAALAALPLAAPAPAPIRPSWESGGPGVVQQLGSPVPVQASTTKRKSTVSGADEMEEVEIDRTRPQPPRHNDALPLEAAAVPSTNALLGGPSTKRARTEPPQPLAESSSSSSASTSPPLASSPSTHGSLPGTAVELKEPAPALIQEERVVAVVQSVSVFSSLVTTTSAQGQVEEEGLGMADIVGDGPDTSDEEEGEDENVEEDVEV